MAIADVSGKSITELLSLQGRVAVVTGAARGIGRASAARLAEAGATVVVADVDGDLADRVATEIAEQHGAGTRAHRADVRDADDVEALVASAAALGDGIDIFVNNAGIYPSTAFLDISHDEWDRVLDTNVRGMFLCSQAVGPAHGRTRHRRHRERRVDGRGEDRSRSRALHHVEARGRRPHPARRRSSSAPQACGCSQSRRA